MYRPSELVVRDDTLRLICSAANDTFDIYVQGQAPFPVCAPDTHAINFNWIFAGDTVYRSLFVRNPGTATLHIDALEDPLPFWVEPHGPLEIPADSSVELTIGFTAAMADTFERTLAINSDEPDAPDSVRLKGRTLSHSTDADETPGLPTEFAVYPAYPNPFNATVTIRFDLPVAQLVELVLFDIQGRRVKSVLSGMTNAGSHVVQIDGGNFASGIYFAALKAGNNRIVQKLLLVK